MQALKTGMMAYKASKAALNSLTISWAQDLGPETGFTFVAIHPGVVSTRQAQTNWRHALSHLHSQACPSIH